MINHALEMNKNDREHIALGLGLSLLEFDSLIESANKAYRVIQNMGPFYGKEEIKEPTFRTTAKPVILTQEHKKQLELLGEDLLAVGKALHNLPDLYKDRLSDKADYKIPPTWRVDAILDQNGQIRMNELEGVDSASALMVAEQLAYNLQTLEQSTIASLVPTIKAMAVPLKADKKYRIAMIRASLKGNLHTPNAKRFAELLESLSDNKISVDLIDGEKLRMGKVKPKWDKYHGVINETLFSSKMLGKLGLRQRQILSSGNFNAIGNKGVFALIFDKQLEKFWKKEIGIEALKRLQAILIPTKFINTIRALNSEKALGKVVKISWSDNMVLLNRSKGVAIPEGDLEQSSDERWDKLKELLQAGAKLISQEYVKPAQIKAFLRKRGNNLEPVEWYNRVCVKYVVNGDPHHKHTNKVSMTAVEVTLGPNVIPAGRQCAFTAGTFK